jgi:hypothetical protein
MLAEVFIISVKFTMYDNADPNKVNSTLILYRGTCQRRRFQTLCHIRIIFDEYNISRNINIMKIKIIQVKGFFELKFFEILYLDKD